MRSQPYKPCKTFAFLLSLILLFVNLIPNLTIGDDVESKPELETSSDTLPYPLSRGSAVWIEEQQSIYIFGGRNETEILDSIMKYSPKNDKLEILKTRLPTVLMGSTAVFNGKYVYIFGGKDYDDFYDTILRFDPKTEKITNMTAHLPNPTVGAAAVWTGEYIYFFGGSWGATIPEKYDSILKYDPINDNITIMNSRLTFGRSGLAAVLRRSIQICT
jgi:N-acetylneuraminic acid mutarotase